MSFFAKVSVILSVVLTLTLGAVTLVLAFDQTNDAQVEADRRHREACDRMEAIVEAFDAYTDALVGASQRPGLTPAEQAERAEREAAFRADLSERLKPLEPTDC